MFNILDVSGSALSAGRLRMDVIASNIANVETTRTGDGGPYRRRSVLLGEPEQDRFNQLLRSHMEALPHGVRSSAQHHNSSADGVEVRSITEDPSPPQLRYDPDHPDADEEGYVAYPNVDVVREMTDLIAASRSYQANSRVMEINRNMISSTLRMGR